MRKKAPKIQYEDGKYNVENNFIFNSSPVILTENNETIMKISFDWSVELEQKPIYYENIDKG